MKVFRSRMSFVDKRGAAHHIQDGVQHYLQVDPGGPVVVLDRSGH